MGSESGRLLSQSLGCRRVYPDRNYKPKRNHVIINWGNSTIPNWYNSPVEWAVHLNDIHAVHTACNKYKTFLQLSGEVSIPDFTTETEVAQQWIDEGFKVFGRQSLTSHSGNDIIIFDSETICTPFKCPLYTKAIRKSKEYRVHVFQGEIIDYQQKKKREGFEGGIAGIRNHANGWVYTRESVNLPDNVAEQSIKAVNVLGLDFGAVDICTERDTGTAFVFEINTAPGLTGTTLNKYTEAIRRICNE